MTQIDKYLSQYLDGSISEEEILEFRDLLESEPQLQTELRQVLDMRSLIHDDLLELTPPESLAENVREQVEARFALLAEEEEEEKKPLFFLTERFAGSLVTAMIALLVIALAPGLLHSPVGEGPDGSIAGFLTPVVSGNSQTLSPQESPAIEHSALPTSTSQRSPNTTNIVLVNTPTFDAVDAFADVAVSMPNDIAATIKTVSNEVIQSNVVEISGALSNERSNMFAVIPTDKDNTEDVQLTPESFRRDVLVGAFSSSDVRTNAALFDKSTELVAKDEQNRQQIAATIERHRTSGVRVGEESSSPRLSFGFTVGAGGLTRSSSAVAVTQRAGYATYNLNDDSRIGVEAGGSTFRYTHTSFTQTEVPIEAFGKANSFGIYESIHGNNVANSTAFAINGLGGIGNSGTNTSGNGNGQNTGGSSGGGSNVIDLNKNNEGQLLSGGLQPGSTAQPRQNVRGIVKAHSYESDTAMGYGMVFYDHKVVALSDLMKIHGRVGVGGTDGGLIFDVRAYAAFATHENVAITVGVGGSALREFESETPVSANYGVQVGAELGF